MFSNLSPTERIVYVLLAAVGLGVAGFLGSAHLRKPAEIVFEPAKSTATEQASGPIVVHIAGAVNKPGVVTMTSGDRVRDAIEKAGGAKANADVEQINLAAPLVDGSQLFIPEKGTGRADSVASEYRGGVQSDSAIQYAFHSQGSSRSARETKKVPAPASISLNSSSLEQLQQLPGVGPATALQIVDYRKSHGKFSSIDELLVIRGIGQKKLAKMRPYLKL